jgi:hypothetical protein
VLLAAARWAQLLQRSTVTQAGALLKGRPEFADLTTTQYAAGLQLLAEIEAIGEQRPGEVLLHTGWKHLSREVIASRLLGEVLAGRPPAWLMNADDVETLKDLPEDVRGIGNVLGVPEPTLAETVGHAWSKVDVAQREQLGLAGEFALAGALSSAGVSVDHISLRSDAEGYDLDARVGQTRWQLEVKSTSRRGRLLVYLSRHEFETGLRSHNWKLVVAGLDSQSRLRAVAEVGRSTIAQLVPTDQDTRGRWDAVRLSLRAADVSRGLSFLPSIRLADGEAKDLILGSDDRPDYFAWMPPR